LTEKYRLLIAASDRIMEEKEANNGYVVIKWNIHESAEKQDGGEGGGVTQSPYF
jgi:hypothetical protein